MWIYNNKKNGSQDEIFQVDMVRHGLLRAFGQNQMANFEFWWMYKGLLQVSSDENSVVIWYFLKTSGLPSWERLPILL